VAWLRAIQRGGKPEAAPWTPGMSEEQVNAWIFEKNHTRALSDVLADSERVSHELIELVEQTSEEDLFDTQRYEWLGGNAVADSIPGNTFDHYREHAANISRWLEGLATENTYPSKTELLEEWRQERARWEALLAELGPQRAVEPTLPGNWSLKDVIAHLTAWQERSVTRLDAARRGVEPQLEDWDDESILGQVNAQIYEQNRDRSLDAVLAQWRRVLGQLIELLEVLPDDVLNDQGRFAWLGGEPLITVPRNSLGHYREEHWESLQVALKSPSAAPA
jgi:hypothetical protein